VEIFKTHGNATSSPGLKASGNPDINLGNCDKNDLGKKYIPSGQFIQEATKRNFATNERLTTNEKNTQYSFFGVNKKIPVNNQAGQYSQDVGLSTFLQNISLFEKKNGCSTPVKLKNGKHYINNSNSYATARWAIARAKSEKECEIMIEDSTSNALKEQLVRDLLRDEKIYDSKLDLVESDRLMLDKHFNGEVTKLQQSQSGVKINRSLGRSDAD
jgi:hypothetical protein